jgi:type IV secretory pathway VirB2 component (pilin)
MNDWAYAGNGLGALSAMNLAVEWANRTFTGAVGAAVAVLAVAAIGFMLLSGRVPVQRGISVMIGCFVLFSSATIATALVETLQSGREAGTDEPVLVSPAPAPPPPAASAPAQYDPYAGASVPTRAAGGHDLLQ